MTGHYSEKTLDDHLNLFHLHADYFADLLVQLSVELVLFNRPPHLGADYLLCAVAQRMGVRTIVLEQLLIPDSFQICEGSENIEKAPVISEREPVRLDKKHEKDLFYMKRPMILSGYAEVVRDRSARRGREAGLLDYCNPVNGAAFIWWKMDLNASSRLVKDMLCRRRRGQAIFRYRRERQYQRDLAEATVDSIDLDRPYVYFPLHMQPERTTSASGGDYCDQVLAIERLAAWLPDDWLVIVKEHPVQTSYMRGPWFFKRLALTKKARLVSKKFDTIALTTKAKFVATITGTVGWEAITGGKCAIVFGDGWYRDFPGAFEFSPKLALEEVLSFEINHEELETRVYEMLLRCGRGIVASAYAVQIEDFDRASNTEMVVGSLKAYFEKGVARGGAMNEGGRGVEAALGEN